MRVVPSKRTSTRNATTDPRRKKLCPNVHVHPRQGDRIGLKLILWDRNPESKSKQLAEIGDFD
jgi:hypothetical protein